MENKDEIKKDRLKKISCILGDRLIELDKKDIKVLKTLMVEIEKEHCRNSMKNVRERQENDQRLKTLYKILGY